MIPTWLPFALVVSILLNGWMAYKMHNYLSTVFAWAGLMLNAYVVLSLLYMSIIGE